MSRHEIDIEGLGKDLEPVKWGRVSIGDSYLSPKGHLIKNSQSPPSDMRLIVRRKVRKYDWSKTLDDVLTTSRNPGDVIFMPLKYSGHENCRIAEIWQPNIHGKCPVDGEACIVRVKRANGSEYTALANNITWEFTSNPILGWQFLRLADGWEF